MYILDSFSLIINKSYVITFKVYFITFLHKFFRFLSSLISNFVFNYLIFMFLSSWRYRSSKLCYYCFIWISLSMERWIGEAPSPPFSPFVFMYVKTHSCPLLGGHICINYPDVLLPKVLDTIIYIFRGTLPTKGSFIQWV